MIFAPLIAAVALSLSASQDAKKSEFADLFRRVTAGIENHYYDRSKRWDFVHQMITRYRSLAEAAKTRDEFSTIVNQMVDEFGDSHFDFFDSGDQGYYLMSEFIETPKHMPNIGMWFGEEETVGSFKGLKILMVMEDCRASQFGVHKGDFIIGTASGERFEPIESLRGKDEIEVRVARVSPKGLISTKTLTLPVSMQQASAMFFGAMKKSQYLITAGTHKVGYVKLWTLLNDDFRVEFSNSLRVRFKEADALIVDLRDGFGGSPRAIAEMLGAKVQGPYAGSAKTLFSRPIVVLTNGGTRSAKEMVAHYLKKDKRAFLIGQRTAGHVLGAMPVRVADWAMLEVPAVDVTEGPERLEKVGVTPHLEVADAYDDGKDLILSRGIQYAQELLDKQRAA